MKILKFKTKKVEILLSSLVLICGLISFTKTDIIKANQPFEMSIKNNDWKNGSSSVVSLRTKVSNALLKNKARTLLDIDIPSINSEQKPDLITEYLPIGSEKAGFTDKEQNSCNKQILNNYKIGGYDISKISNHSFCPMIRNNCCSEYDQQNTINDWNSNTRKHIEAYYGAFLNGSRYLLGYYPLINELAEDIQENFKNWVILENENQDDEVQSEKKKNVALQCLNSAKLFLEFDFNPEKITEIVESFYDLIRSYKELRSSFYCVLCDGDAQSTLKRFWSVGNTKTKNTIFYSREFCNTFTEETIKGTYNYIFYFRNYLNHMKTLINCKLNDQVKNGLDEDTFNSVDFVIKDIETKKHIEKCYYSETEDKFEDCKDFCSGFNLTKINPLYEGELTVLSIFVEFVKTRINEVFDDPKNVLLHNTELGLEYFYLDSSTSRGYSEFFRPEYQKNMIDEMNGDVLNVEGINPYYSGKRNTYQLKIKESQNILSIVLLGVLSILIKL